MTEIEFLHPDEHPSEPGEPELMGGDGPEHRRGLFDRDLARMALAVALLAASAALVVVAAFQRVYTVHESDGIDHFATSVDGWGRYRATDGSPVPDGFHEPRFGIVLSVVAGALVLAAAVLLTTVARRVPAGIGRAARAAVVVATLCSIAALGAVVAVIGLQVNAVFDSFRATANLSAFSGGPPGHIRLQLDVGPCLWYGLAGLAAALPALIAAHALSRRAAEAGTI